PTDATAQISIATNGLTAGTCNGSLTINATVASTGAAAVNSPLVIPVNVIVSTTPLLITVPASISFTVAAGAQSPAPQTITLSSTNNETLNYTITNVNGTANGITWLF